MRIEAISIGDNPPDDINVIVEVPIGGEPVKYEMDKEAGAMIVDRILYTAMQYPGNYGFVPHTLSDDGDPIDVLIANQRTIMPGAVINCRPIGALMMTDEAGQDEKLIAVPSGRVSQLYEDVHSIFDLPEIQRKRIAHFFERYKDLEGGKWVKVERWADADEARDLIRKAIKAA
ncbi:MAG: inorganic diphosphatase [Ahrensia sp.]|nr:inorganic diphosphatase [Ahrensia sp.]